METDRRGSAIAGLLAIAGMVAGALSVVPVLEQPDYLARITTQERQFLLGAGFQLLMVPAYVGFALYLYPTLRRADRTLSLGFVGFRLLAGMFHLVGVILLPLFLVLGQGAVDGGAAGASSLEVVGEVLRWGRDLINHVAVIVAVGAADLFLFRLLYRWRLAPRWLAVWGALGVGLAITASLLVLFRVLDVVTPGYLVMNAPLALQSLVLAIWLVARGLDTTSLPTTGGREPYAAATR